MAQTNQGYLPTLDGWRTLAILAVVVDHLVGYSLQTRFPVLFSITRIGPNGVSLFFAISGFLICSRLLEEQARTGAIHLKGFYIRRASRILPPAMTYLVFVGLLGAIGVIAITRWELWGAALFFRNYQAPRLGLHEWGGYTIHYWSLAVEEHFYILWPGLLVLAGPRRAKWAAGGLAIIIACWRSIDMRYQIFESHFPGVLFGSRTDVRLDGLLMGCLVALLLADAEWRARFMRVINSWVWWCCVVGYLLLQVVLRRHYYTLLESTLLAVIVSSTVLRPETWVGRFLELRWMRWAGRLSYSLYLWQQLFLVPGARFPWSLAQKFPANCALLLLVSAMSYGFLERPFIRLGHKLAPPPTPGREDIAA